MLSIPLRLNPAGWRRPLMRVAALVAAAALAAPVDDVVGGDEFDTLVETPESRED